MSFPSLPLELLQAIARLLPQHALPAFARTSSALAQLAQRVLYRHLTPTHRTLVLIPLLARKQHIARHVRSFHLALDPAAPIFAPFYTLLVDALHNMSDLHSLHLHLDPSASWVLRSAAPTHLVHFTATFPLDDNVARFLHLTPALRELELDSTIRSPASLPSLPETSIPRLEQFIGSSCAASLVVPGRPVSSIHLHESTLSEDDIPLLARSSAQVLVLQAITNSSPVPFLHLLCHHLPHLAYLRVSCTHPLSHSPVSCLIHIRSTNSPYLSGILQAGG